MYSAYYHPLRFLFTAIYFLLGSAWLSAQSPAPELTEPENLAKPAIITQGEVQMPWLGFEIRPADETVRAQLPKLPKGVGFLIYSVYPKSPAQQAGLTNLDVLWKFNDQLLVNEAQLAVLLQHHKPGDSISLHYFRSGENKEAKVTLGHAPEAHPLAAGPSIDSLNKSVALPSMQPSKTTVDINTRIASLEDGDNLLEMELHNDGPWLCITNENGEVVFDGLVDDKSQKTIPAKWQNQVASLKKILVDKVDCGRTPRFRSIVPHPDQTTTTVPINK